VTPQQRDERRREGNDAPAGPGLRRPLGDPAADLDLSPLHADGRRVKVQVRAPERCQLAPPQARVRARAGNLVALRTELLELGADPTLVDSLDTAAQADHILDRLLDNDSADLRHPLAVRVLPQPLSELLAWPLKDTPPRAVLATNRPARRGVGVHPNV
jgi:hypothetical protein